jgi:hypothetical protein
MTEGTKEIRANRFVLEDENGKKRAELSMLIGGPGLTLYDGDGLPRASLVLIEGTAALHLSDENDKSSIEVSTSKGWSTICLRDKNGKDRINLSMLEDEPSLTMDAKNRPGCIFLGMTKDKSRSPLLVLRDENLESGLVISMAEDEHGAGLSLAGGNGKSGVKLWATPGGGSLIVHDANGTMRALLGVDGDSPGALVLFDEHGKAVWRSPR